MTVAIVVTNYNMPEACDRIAAEIHRRVYCDYELIVVDNGSDLQPAPRYSKVLLPENVQTTGGWLAGLDYADKLGKFDYYMFLITSMSFDDGNYDPITPMVEFMDAHPEAVGIHPALTPDSTTSWEHLKTRGGNEPRRTWMIDNICSMYRADWFNEIGRFDPHMIYAWGIDLETCMKARMQGRSLWVDERVKVKKVTNIGYTMNRMNMNADTRSRLAGENMRAVLFRKYGPLYWEMAINGNVKDEWR